MTLRPWELIWDLLWICHRAIKSCTGLPDETHKSRRSRMWSQLKRAVSSALVWNMLHEITADSSEDRKPDAGVRGQQLWVRGRMQLHTLLQHLEQRKSTSTCRDIHLCLESSSPHSLTLAALSQTSLKSCQTGTMQICNCQTKIDHLSEELFYIDKPVLLFLWMEHEKSWMAQQL